MLCQDCRQRVATVLLTEIGEGSKQVLHLCASCVQKRGVPTPVLKNPLQPEILFTGTLGTPLTGEPPLGEHEADHRTCPVCGWAYVNFRETGLLGCPDCYESFSGPLEELVQQLHGAGEHLGRSYEGPEDPVERSDDAEAIRAALKMAVESEEFERAAMLRDRLTEIQQGS